MSSEAAEQLRQLCEERKIVCIHGHFSLALLRDVFPDARRITFLRDPIDRLLSDYYYQRNRHDIHHSPLGMQIRSGELSFEGALERYARINVFRDHGVTTSSIDEFDFVGLAEQYERSLTLLGRIVPELDGLKVEHKNVTPHKPDRRDGIDDKLYASLETMQEQELRTFETAKERFEKDCSRHGV